MESKTSIRHIVFLGLAALIGIFAGLSLFTFNYAEGLSYMSNDPDACVNCHIMRDQYNGWNHSTHKDFATCNDCHTPHEFPDKWIIKGINGWNHSFAFTTGWFDEPIQITERNARIAEDNCLECHEVLVSQVWYDAQHEEELDCLACHSNVGHDS